MQNTRTQISWFVTFQGLCLNNYKMLCMKHGRSSVGVLCERLAEGTRAVTVLDWRLGKCIMEGSGHKS